MGPQKFKMVHATLPRPIQEQFVTVAYIPVETMRLSILYRFQFIASYLSKVADFKIPIWRPAGDDSVRISRRSLASENSSIRAIVWRCLS